MALKAHPVIYDEIGYFRVFVTPKGGRRREITFFRGAATKVTKIDTTDPFTDAAITLEFPQITIFDTPGSGDLDWFAPYSDIDVIWENTGDNQYDWRFEGFIISPNYSSDESGQSTSLEIKGALYLLDNWLAKPSFPPQPIPYEVLMAQAFDQRKHPSSLAPFSIEWPVNSPSFQNLPSYGNELPIEDVPHAGEGTGGGSVVDQPQFRVMTWNLNSGYQSGSISWPNRLPRILAKVVEVDPEIICFTEAHEDFTRVVGGVTVNNLEELDTGLPAKYTLIQGDGGDHIFYDSTVFTHVSHAQYAIPASRDALEAVLEHTSSAMSVTVVCTHFIANDTDGTSRAADRLLETNFMINRFANRQDEQIILAGDINMTSQTSAGRPLFRNAGFVALREAYDNVINATFNSYQGYASHSPTSSNWDDEIYTRKVWVTDGALIETLDCSDHNLLYADVSLVAPGTVVTPPVDDGGTTYPGSGDGKIDKLMVVLMENHGYTKALAGMPYAKALGAKYGQATNHHALTHPSLPNYLALAAGSNLGVTDDGAPSSHKLTGKNVFGEAIKAGRTAKVYCDGMAGNAQLGNGGNKYAVRHNPWVYFPGDAVNYKKYDVPYQVNFSADVTAGTLPNLSFVVPNTVNDAHGGSLSAADTFMQNLMAEVTAGPDWKAGRLAVVMTFDEDGHEEGNRVLTVVAHPSLDKKVVTTSLTHYSLSGAMSEIGHSNPILNAAGAPNFLQAFGLSVGTTTQAITTVAPTITTLAAPVVEDTPDIPPGETWGRRVPAAGADYNRAFRYAYLRPWGVVPGQLWTGFTTRSTGGWENLLSGYIQGLLSVMFEEAGAQWTIRKDNGRKPVLYLREIPSPDDPDILEIDAGAPGVIMNLSRDFSQSADTIFGEGQDDAGTTYSNAQVSVTDNGPFTDYEPFAYNPATYPVEPKDSTGKGNPNRNTNLTPKEAHIKFPQGMDLSDAKSLSRAQKNRFSDPGVTGTIQLKIDPRLATGAPFPRLLVKAGRSLRIKGLFGIPGGVLVHITTSSISVDDMVLNITVDSKYRDSLTVAEVRARTRDALTPLRSLQVGKYTNTVQDLLFPWSYELGSGVIPSGGDLDATPFFKNVAADDRFPYENVTRTFPPKSHGSYYIKIPKNPTRASSTDSWTKVGIPIRMSATGSIRLSQVAIYDADGNVLPVKFHLSIYSTNGVSAQDMPILIGASSDPRDFKYRYLKPPNLPDENYKVGQRYPFYETAWEQVNELGESFTDGEFNRYPSNAGIVVGWGNFFEPAGFAPGRFSRGAPASGMLVDETQWSWDVTSLLNQQKASDNASNPDYGRLWAMAYCDDLPDQDVFMMGRLFRVEPGGQ